MSCLKNKHGGRVAWCLFVDGEQQAPCAAAFGTTDEQLTQGGAGVACLIQAVFGGEGAASREGSETGKGVFYRCAPGDGGFVSEGVVKAGEFCVHLPPGVFGNSQGVSRRLIGRGHAAVFSWAAC